MATYKKPDRLLIEYNVLNFEKSLKFYFYSDAELLDSFVFEIKEGTNYIDLIEKYENALMKLDVNRINNVDLVLNTFDIGSTILVKNDKNEKFIKTIMEDTLGSSYKDTFYWFKSEIDLDDKNKIESNFYLSSSRVKEVADILKRINISRCKVIFINQYLTNFMSESKINDGILVYSQPKYYLINVVKGGNNIAFAFVDKKNKAKSVLNSLENAINAIYLKISQVKDVELPIFYLNEKLTDEFLKYKKTVIIKNFSFEKLFSKSIVTNVVDIQTFKQAKPVEKKKSSFFSFGKKGFTLIESAVSLSIFAIVGALTISFINYFNIRNTDNKRKIYAENYIKTVYTLLQSDPGKETVSKITSHPVSQLDNGTNSFYYLNSSMDAYKSSASDKDMVFKVSFTYQMNSLGENELANYTKYIFSVNYIMTKSGSKIYTSGQTLVVVK